MTAVALLDSNVVIAMMVLEHPHHAASAALVTGGPVTRFAVAAHSFAEAYNILTRQGDRAPYRFAPADAAAALENLRSVTDLLGLTAARTFEGVRGYARAGGIGARLYDALIGEVAVAHGISAIVTWNVAHMSGLFPDLVVATPISFADVRLGDRAP